MRAAVATAPRSPCNPGWCAREAGTDTHARMDTLEDKIDAIAAQIKHPIYVGVDLAYTEPKAKE